MSILNKFYLNLPFMTPKTPEEHHRNNAVMASWSKGIPLNERVRVLVRRTSNQTIATNTVTEINWQVANDGANLPSDPYEFWNLTRSASRLVCPTGLGGVYLIEVTARLGGGEVTNVIMGIRKNGICKRRRHEQYNTGTDSIWNGMLVRTLELVPGDYITAWGYHESGTDRNFEVSVATENADVPFEPLMIMTRIAA